MDGVICPCCGQPVPDKLDLIEAARYVDMTSSQRTIFATMARRLGQWVTTDQLISALWADDIDGGPENPRNVISVQLLRMRQTGALTRLGVTVESHGGRAERRMVRL